MRPTPVFLPRESHLCVCLSIPFFPSLSVSLSLLSVSSCESLTCLSVSFLYLYLSIYRAPSVSLPSVSASVSLIGSPLSASPCECPSHSGCI